MPNKHGQVGLEDAADHRHGGNPPVAGGIARTVGQEHAVGVLGQNLLGRGGGGHDGDVASGAGEAAQDVAFRPVIQRDDPRGRGPSGRREYPSGQAQRISSQR